MAATQAHGSELAVVRTQHDAVQRLGAPPVVAADKLQVCRDAWKTEVLANRRLARKPAAVVSPILLQGPRQHVLGESPKAALVPACSDHCHMDSVRPKPELARPHEQSATMQRPNCSRRRRFGSDAYALEGL